MVQYGPKYRGVQPGRSRQRAQKPYVPDSGDMARALLFQTLGQVASGATGELLSKGGALRRAITPAETLEAEAAARQAGLAGKRATTRKTQAEAYDIGERGRLRQAKHELGHREESGRTFRQAMGDRSAIELKREEHRLEKDMLKHKRALKARGTNTKGVWVKPHPDGGWTVVTEASLKSARKLAQTPAGKDSLNTAEATSFLSKIDEGSMRNEGFVRYPSVKSAQQGVGYKFTNKAFRDPISLYGYAPESKAPTGAASPTGSIDQELKVAQEEKEFLERERGKVALPKGRGGTPLTESQQVKHPRLTGRQKSLDDQVGAVNRRISGLQSEKEDIDLNANLGRGHVESGRRIVRKLLEGVEVAASQAGQSRGVDDIKRAFDSYINEHGLFEDEKAMRILSRQLKEQHPD
jgi:hypothetical protein